MRFSDRVGATKPKVDIQVDWIEPELRNALWDIMAAALAPGGVSLFSSMDIRTRLLYHSIWQLHLKEPLDTLPCRANDALLKVRREFMECPWYDVYNLLELIVQHSQLAPKITLLTNQILERELSAYRIVNDEVVQISDRNEIETIEQALEDTESSELQPVRCHLSSALSLLSDRQKPDFRNSIKESVSAVEALCRLVSGNPKATLGDALKAMQKSSAIELHPALEKGFSAIYGYTNDAEGIRHAMSAESNLDLDDAKYMLVACSAFVNYLIGKVAKANLTLS